VTFYALHRWRRPLFPGEKGKYINVFCFPGLFPTEKGRETASEIPNIASPISFPGLYPREKDKATRKHLFNYLFPPGVGASSVNYGGMLKKATSRTVAETNAISKIHALNDICLYAQVNPVYNGLIFGSKF